MGLRVWHDYGIVHIKIEEIDSNGDVVSVIDPSTVMYLPIQATSSNPPSSGKINGQPANYYENWFNDINFLGSYYIIVKQSNYMARPWYDAALLRLRHFFPLTISLAVIGDGSRVKVTDIESGQYFICNQDSMAFYNKDGASMASLTTSNGGPSFKFADSNFYNGAFCIKGYRMEGSICTITQLNAVGVRDSNPNNWPIYDTRPNVAGVRNWFNNVGTYKPLPSDTDPYKPGGTSGPGGGGGHFTNNSVDVDVPSLPSLSAVDTSFISLFCPSVSELRSLANYMWSNLFDVDTFKKIFADPMDAILGLSIVPVHIPRAGSGAVTIGNISTGVSMGRASQQYVEVDCGTINVDEFWGAYLDYDPFTKAEIYLPYIGTHAIAVDDIMNKAVKVVYHVDILSGACCAYVKCGGSVLYSFVGQCSCSIPVTGNDWTNVINGALSIAASIGTMVATGGANAPMAASSIASSAVNSLKPTVERSGSLGGMGGMMGIQRPYLILTRPNQALPLMQNRFTGYPSFITANLYELSGYTEVENIHLEDIPATEEELEEILQLLKNGVMF